MKFQIKNLQLLKIHNRKKSYQIKDLNKPSLVFNDNFYYFNINYYNNLIDINYIIFWYFIMIKFIP